MLNLTTALETYVTSSNGSKRKLQLTRQRAESSSPRDYRKLIEQLETIETLFDKLGFDIKVTKRKKL